MKLMTVVIITIITAAEIIAVNNNNLNFDRAVLITKQKTNKKDRRLTKSNYVQL